MTVPFPAAGWRTVRRALAAAAGAIMAAAAPAAGPADGIVPEWARPPGADAPDPRPARRAPGRPVVLPRPAPAPPAPMAPPPRTTTPARLPPSAPLAAPAASPPPGVPARPGLSQKIDALQRDVENGVIETVRRFDRFFGDEELDDDNPGTRVRFAPGFRVDAEDGLSFEQRFRVRLALPNLENRLQIIADNMFEAEEANSAEAIRDAAQESKPDAGLRYVFKENEKLRFSADAGLRLGGSPQVFGKLRGRLSVPYDPWEMRLVQTLQWYSRDGFGETSEMRWSRFLASPAWLFYSSTRIGWQEDRSGVTPSQRFTWQKQVAGEWGHRYTIKAEWPETPSTTDASYALEYGYRRLIYRDWLFLEIAPGLDFSQTRDYEPNPYVTCLIEVSFDQASR